MRRTSLDWNPADAPKDRPKWPAEDRVLAKPGGVNVDREVRKNPDDEVPVRRVRCDDCDELRRVRERTSYSPAEQTQAQDADAPKDRPPFTRYGGRNFGGDGTGAGRQLGRLWCLTVMRPRVRS